MALPEHIHHLIATYGYGLVFLLVALENIGLPLPGETVLIAGAVYAARTHRLDLLLVILTAAAGAAVGGFAGYLVGREAGYPLLLRFGPRIGLKPDRLKLGQYLFMRHGPKVVVFGRFVALLRLLASLLAGLNRMSWARFLAWNATGALLWATIDGGGAYLLGGQVDRVLGPLGIAVLVVAGGALVVGWFYLRRHEAALLARAEAALPGPIEARHPRQK